MSEIIKKIKELNELKENILSKIKCLYVFKDYYKNDKNVLIVTNDDNVFALGDNNCGVLGFGNDREVKEITINENLSHKQIVDFKNGWKHVIGRTVDGKVYCWGNNGIFGVLGNGKNDLEICKPELNEYLNDKQIIDICCGFNHSLVLTNSGELYAWGGNWFGQIGNENYDNQSIPIKVNGFNDEKIVMISCGEWHSMALTESGHVFSWGLNSSGQMGLENTNKANKPSIVSLSIKIPIKKISCGREHSLLLSRDGDIYWFGNNGCETKISPKKLTINSNKFIDIASHNEYYISIALSLNGIYYIWGNCGEKVIKIPKETEFKSFNDIFVEYFQITYKTLNKTSKYKLEFKELELIGIGGFGKVYKVLDSLDGKQYAMKIISTEGFKDEFRAKILKELDLMTKLQSDYVVNYYSWIESNETLYIKMELCFNTLRKVLEQKQNEFKRKRFEFMTPLEYYISSELLKELLEAVDYLHKQNIIHRDLRPEKILIAYGTNGRFVKLGDFGLSAIHEFNEQTHTQNCGTDKYMAPEVMRRRRYDTKADIYSLGIVIQDLFNFDINKPIDESSELEKKYSYIYEMTEKMTSISKYRRPNCEDLLELYKFWAISIEDLKVDVIQKYLSSTDSGFEFCKHFMNIKWNKL